MVFATAHVRSHLCRICSHIFVSFYSGWQSVNQNEEERDDLCKDKLKHVICNDTRGLVHLNTNQIVL